MRLDKDPSDNWSKKFGVECLDGDVPTWEEPDWPTCASSKFWLQQQVNFFLCQISPAQTLIQVASTVTLQLTGLRAKYQDTHKASSNATFSLSCYNNLQTKLIKPKLFISLKCTDERYLLKRNKKEAVRELTATCLWSQSWSFDLSDLKCELTFCRPDPSIPPDSKVLSVSTSQKCFFTHAKRRWSTPKTGQGLGRESCTNALLVPTFSI